MRLCLYYALILGIKDPEIVHLDDGMKVRHLCLGKTFPDHLVHEEDLCLRVIYEMVDVC